MSRDIIVLMPNGRRLKVNCTPDTSILQVLEEACQKQGYEPTGYDLKHYNKILDLTSTIRFANLPNKATLEMVESESQRKETNVTVGLLLADGERKTGEFPPNTSLYEVIVSLACTELNALQNPSILYTRQEVTGISALKEKTLRHLGLIGGRAILRLLNKSEEAKQANVSAVYGRQNPKDDSSEETDSNTTSKYDHNSMPGPSNEPKKVEDSKINFINLIKKEKIKEDQTKKKDENDQNNPMEIETENEADKANKMDWEKPMEIETQAIKKTPDSNTTLMSQDNLERRLKIEEEVTFVGTKKAIVFKRQQDIEELDDLPDDFYELTIEEVRRLYNDLKQQRIQLENTPLMVSTKREELQKQTSEQKLNDYKNVVVRIQFPDQFILQGIFNPSDTIEDIFNFVKEHIENPNEPFHIFTTPLKETLDPKKTLLEAKFVPCVHMHFKLLNNDGAQVYLKKELYLNQTSSDAAGILASKYRAPTKRKTDNNANHSQSANVASTSKNSKLPKWLKS